MDMGIDIRQLLADTQDREAFTGERTHIAMRAPEWAEIRCRLATAQSARRALMRSAATGWSRGSLREGSFNATGATLLAAFGTRLDAVNPNSSGFGKRDLRMILPAAGANISGGRG